MFYINNMPYTECEYNRYKLELGVHDMYIKNQLTITEPRYFAGTKIQSITSDLPIIMIGDMTGTFEDCTYLYTIPKLITNKVNNMSNMFSNTSIFDEELSIDTSNVINMKGMFQYSAYNKPVNFNTINVVDVSKMFMGSLFNNTIDINMYSVKWANYMFFNASVFDKDINISSMTRLEQSDLMFYGTPMWTRLINKSIPFNNCSIV